MAARYDFRKAPNPQGGEREEVLYPRLVSKGTVAWDRLVEEVAHDSGFTPGTIVGVMQELEHRMLRHLSEGYRVQLGDMCYAEPTVELAEPDRRVTDEGELHARSVRFGKVCLQPQKGFRPEGELQRAESARKFGHSSSRLTADERYARLMDYLDNHPFITRAQYSELTGLLRSNAQRELNGWIAARRLASQGRAPHRVYVKPLDD